MNSRLLESFVIVADNDSIAEAARRLNLTPAGVAQRIRALEAEIGTCLVVRSGHRVVPTEAGMAILSRSRSFLAELRDLKSIALKDRPSGKLRLGATRTSTMGILPDVLKLLTARYPDIEVHVIGANGAELNQSLIDDELDAAIISRPPFAIPKAYEWEALWEEELVLVAPVSKRNQDPHLLLASEPFIRPRRNSWLGTLVDGYLRHAGIHPHERFELDQFEAIMCMVDGGLGVTLHHMRISDSKPLWSQDLSLAKIPLPENQFARSLGLAWNRSSARLRLVQAFLEVVVETLAANKVRPLHARGVARTRHTRKS